MWQRNIAVYNSYNFFIYFGLYSILNKMNLIGIIYWISVWRIVSHNFKPNIFKKDKGTLLNPVSCTKYNLKAQFGTFKNQQIVLLLKLHLVMLSIFIVW